MREEKEIRSNRKQLQIEIEIEMSEKRVHTQISSESSSPVPPKNQATYSAAPLFWSERIKAQKTEPTNLLRPYILGRDSSHKYNYSNGHVGFYSVLPHSFLNDHIFPIFIVLSLAQTTLQPI